MENQDNSSCELYTDSIHNELKRNKDDINSSKHFCEHIPSNYGEYPRIIEICWEVASHLNYIGKTSLDDNKLKTYCSYLNYLLYDMVLNSNVGSDNYKFIYYIHTPWRRIISKPDFYKKEICQPIFSNMDKKYYAKWKKMFDYCTNSTYIQEKLSPTDSCAKSYCKYIDENKDLFGEFTKVCSIQNKKECPPFFKDCEKNIPSYILNLPQCREYKKSSESSQVTDKGVTVQMSADTARTLQETPLDSSSPMNQSSSSYSNTAMLTTFPTLTILAASLLMYKLTPFGSWLRPHLQRMTKINNISDEEGTELSYTSEYNDINSNEESYNIAYYSGENY
ncbi:PIR Superfamily Protein [Plasmodium ovale wallikeri]|uniref:PIR Superfamily Protein n=2 Tax=Plasmodium ovale TaxID=36330 RepID=A0A1A9AQP1_PLAOA|nr:PIR Superfamily Protein [Plasmodium ovale wallikeri]SBT59524.1 PIR Superfamily Protein [Plasmodium ovale wallikeri]SBT72889.1 PIR protein [Plasmodium ovale]